MGWRFVASTGSISGLNQYESIEIVRLIFFSLRRHLVFGWFFVSGLKITWKNLLKGARFFLRDISFVPLCSSWVDPFYFVYKKRVVQISGLFLLLSILLYHKHVAKLKRQLQWTMTRTLSSLFRENVVIPYWWGSLELDYYNELRTRL